MVVPALVPVVEPVVAPLPCVVVEALTISGFLIFSGFLMLDVLVPAPDVLLPVFVAGVVFVGGTILCWFVGTVMLVVEPVVEPVLEPVLELVPWVG